MVKRKNIWIILLIIEKEKFLPFIFFFIFFTETIGILEIMVKMKNEKPTKKQLYYYDALCKKYGVEKENTEELSRFDLKERISRIIDEHTTDYKNID